MHGAGEVFLLQLLGGFFSGAGDGGGELMLLLLNAQIGRVTMRIGARSRPSFPRP